MNIESRVKVLFEIQQESLKTSPEDYTQQDLSVAWELFDLLPELFKFIERAE